MDHAWLSSVPEVTPPTWLDDPPERVIAGPLCVHTILDGCVYYPSAGFDGLPVELLHKRLWSFVYVDYGKTHAELMSEVERAGFVGYRVVAQRSVSPPELAPHGFSGVPIAPAPRSSRGLDPRFVVAPDERFCSWMIFEREPDRGEEHGPHRFSLLYLTADGVAAYQALFVEGDGDPLPTVLAIIQPGTAFGGNYTDFSDPSAHLHETVAAHSRGMPPVLLYGGIGRASDYHDLRWPEYARLVGEVDRATRAVGVWLRE